MDLPRCFVGELLGLSCSTDFFALLNVDRRRRERVVGLLPEGTLVNQSTTICSSHLQLLSRNFPVKCANASSHHLAFKTAVIQIC